METNKSECWKCLLRCDLIISQPNTDEKRCTIPAKELPAIGVHPDCMLLVDD